MEKRSERAGEGGGLGGGSGGGRGRGGERWGKEGREEMKVADSMGRIHRSIGERLVGNAGQLNK